MSSRDGPFYSGGFHPPKPQRVRSLSEARSITDSGMPYTVRPGTTTHGFLEGPQSQHATSEGTLWVQQYGKIEGGGSTKYEKLFPKMTISELTRANKALVKGGSDSISPGPNSWHGKSYAPSAMTAATLLRINETTTAFGSHSMGSPTHDAGTGLMADVLSEKWDSKSRMGTDWSEHAVDMPALLKQMTEHYPQLHSVEKMRRQGQEGLVNQIVDSRMEAAIAAGRRWLDKGKGWGEIGEYVQRKFKKHGLGAPPKGWAEALRERHDVSMF